MCSINYHARKVAQKLLKNFQGLFKPKILGAAMSSQSNGKVSNSTYYGRGVPMVKNEKVDFWIDLRSDTVTKPNTEMRQWIAKAEVGDDVMGEDYTVKELEDRVAKLLGKEAGLFVPSGTMGNLLALLVHCPTRGSEIIVGDCAHIFKYEQAGMAQFGGIQANKLPNYPDGTFSIDLVRKNIRGDDDHYPTTNLICLENTHNVCGGRVLPQAWIDEVTEVARVNGIPVHMDGARLFNAAVASGVSPERIVRDIDSVNICLSKSLGTPLGSILVGKTDFIRKSRRLRKALGGGMRQIGMMAAAGLYALEKNLPRLEEDHKNAKFVANEVANLNNPFFLVVPEDVESNMVVIHLKNGNSDEVCERFGETPEQEIADLGATIKIISHSRNENSIRLVFHCDVTGELVTKAAQKLCYVANELKRKFEK